MTIMKGTSPEDGREQAVIVCEHTSPEQLATVGKVLERALQSLPGPNSDVPSWEAEWHCIFNMLCDLEVEGYELINPEIGLVPGWNLMGYPYLNESLVNETLDNVNYSIVYGYNNSIWSSYIPNRTFNSLQTLNPGYGYWVKVE